MKKIDYDLARNVFIIIAGGVFTYIYTGLYGNVFKPMIFTGVILFFSFVYTDMFKRPQRKMEFKNLDNVVSMRGSYAISSIISKINNSISVIKEKSQNDMKFRIVSRFINEINEFERTIPKLTEAYKRAQYYTSGKTPLLEYEINEIVRKMFNTSETAKKTYEKALKEKQAALLEIERIKAYLDETESKLYYIASILQKIEAIIESAEINERLTDEDLCKLNTQLETFSESLKDILKSIRL
ncbi:MAG: hypothetical protein N2645_17800 [Clostridia bacterium]|nr:hypothetical protein [Clostridia bacterium]